MHARDLRRRQLARIAVDEPVRGARKPHAETRIARGTDVNEVIERQVDRGDGLEMLDLLREEALLVLDAVP